MKIAIECLALDPSYRGGVNAYALGLIHAFSSIASSSTQFQVYFTEENKSLFSDVPQNEFFKLIPQPAPSTFWRIIRRLSVYISSPSLFKVACNAMWKTTSKKICSENDILYSPGTVFQFYDIEIPSVLSMHDVQQNHYPEFFTKFEKEFRDIAYMLSAKEATLLQASSRFIATDFLQQFSFLRKDQIAIIREGVQLEVFKAGTESKKFICEKYDLQESFIFMPAQLWPHKNHITVLKGLKLLKDVEGFSPQLVLTGAKFGASDDIFQSIAEYGLTEQVKYLGTVPFRDLIALYHAAKFVMTASLYESSSLPILEGVAANSAIIACDAAPNIELGESLEINTFEALNPESLSKLIKSIWHDTPKLQLQIDHNKSAVEQFTWKKAAQQFTVNFAKIIAR